MPVVSEEPLARHEFRTAVAGEIGHRHGVRLRPGVIDQALRPARSRTAGRGLLQPEDAVVVRHRRHDVVEAVPIDIVHEQEPGMPPGIVFRSVFPAARARV